MATLPIDPLIVAKINVLIAASPGGEGGSGFSVEDILSLFDTLLLDSEGYPNTRPITCPEPHPPSQEKNQSA